MKITFRRSVFVLLFFSILTISCQNNNSGPTDEAEIVEFSIEELPETVFEVNQEDGIISPTNPSSIDEGTELSALTASFRAPGGATVYIVDAEQVSGETVNDFTRGVFYTVVSEDETVTETYFVHLEPKLPLSYFLMADPVVEINPSQRNPLTAMVSFEARTQTSVSIEVLGDIPVKKTFDNSGHDQDIPVLGLYPNTENEVVLTVTGPEGISASETLKMQTEALPDFLPSVEIDVLNENQMEPGMHFNEVHIGNAGSFNTHPIIFDNNGDVRWYIDLSEHERITWPIKFNDDGTFFAVFGVTIIEYDMLGNETNRLVVDENGMHHEILKIPNGNYVISVRRYGATMVKNGEEIESTDDHVIEVDPNGSIVTEWDLAEVLDVNRTDLNDGGSDWFHMNAIWYDEEDHSLIISGRNQGIVKVNWDNELQWIMAAHKGWGKAGRYEKTFETAPYLLTAVSANGEAYSEELQQGFVESNNFSWPWGQHTPMILPNGNLFVFDNGFNRNFGNGGSYSLATEYEIDEENMTVQEVWSYGRSRGDELFSSIISDVDLLSETGNRLFIPGVVRTSATPYSKVIELSYPDKQVVFEATLYFKNQLVSGQGWGNLDINYRGERVKLYGGIHSTVAVP